MGRGDNDVQRPIGGGAARHTCGYRIHLSNSNKDNAMRSGDFTFGLPGPPFPFFPSPYDTKRVLDMF
jgi:hypothetical protein